MQQRYGGGCTDEDDTVRLRCIRGMRFGGVVAGADSDVIDEEVVGGEVSGEGVGRGLVFGNGVADDVVEVAEEEFVGVAIEGGMKPSLIDASEDSVGCVGEIITAKREEPHAGWPGGSLVRGCVTGEDSLTVSLKVEVGLALRKLALERCVQFCATNRLT